MKSKIVVACYDASGKPDLFFFIMENIPEVDYNDGLHYDACAEYAEEQGYDTGNAVVFDEGDMSESLEKLFNWGTASIADYEQYK